MTGLPTQAGTFGPTTVCATNSVSPPARQTFTIIINKSSQLILASPSSGGPVGTPARDRASLFGPGPKTGT